MILAPGSTHPKVGTREALGEWKLLSWYWPHHPQEYQLIHTNTRASLRRLTCHRERKGCFTCLNLSETMERPLHLHLLYCPHTFVLRLYRSLLSHYVVYWDCTHLCCHTTWCTQTVPISAVRQQGEMWNGKGAADLRSYNRDLAYHLTPLR